MAKRLPVVGGSHAQRDVFIRSLMAVAMRSRDYPSLRAIASLRHELRQEDRFDRDDRCAHAERHSDWLFDDAASKRSLCAHQIDLDFKITQEVRRDTF